MRSFLSFWRQINTYLRVVLIILSLHMCTIVGFQIYKMTTESEQFNELVAGLNVLAHTLYLINFIYLMKLNNKNQRETERVYREIEQTNEELRELGIQVEPLPEFKRIDNSVNVIGIVVCGLLFILNLSLLLLSL